MLSSLVRRPAPTAARPMPSTWQSTAVVVRRGPRFTLIALAWVEGRRLLRHPLTLAGFGLSLFALVADRNAGAGTAFADLTGGGAPGMWLPPMVFFAATMGASRSRRGGVEETHAAAPVGRPARAAALCAAGLAPMIAALGLILALSAFRAVFDGPRSIVPTPAELMLLPLSVLGAATLGVMVARWLPWRGAAAVVFVGLVAVSIALSDGASSWWTSFVELVEWQDDELSDIRVAGSAPWHAAYLLGLSTMALVGALLRDMSKRTTLLGIGAVVTLLTAGAGWAQLP